MDLAALRIFVHVAELGSFTRASEHLGISKARASTRVAELEAALGSRLLHRSTRAVSLTEDGQQLLPRAKRILREADELSTMFQPQPALRGRVRLDLPIRFARDHIIPRLPELLAAHPQLELLVSTTDRRVDLVREGFDCVMRVGHLPDSALMARRLGVLSMVSCASPAYLRRFGTPTTLDDLQRHYVVGYSHSLGERPVFEYLEDGEDRDRPMRSLVTVNGTDAYMAACLAGLGIAQIPRLGVRASLASGELLEVLPDHTCAPLPVSLVRAAGARARRPVRAVMSWIEQVVSRHLG
ncbi:MAG: LysR family transcriptional regulator [Sandaracinaceae bacterium]